MPRLPLTAAAVVLLTCSGFASVGCQIAPLPEGYAWSGKPASELDYTPRRAGSYRSGFQADRVDSSNASTNRGGKAYNFASVLGGTNSRAGASGGDLSAPSNLSPPSPASGSRGAEPRDLFSGETDPATEFFGSPAPAGYEVRLAPTPVAGRDPGVATHTVTRGDNLWRIAEQAYGSGLRYLDILEANPGINPDRLTVGDRLVLPGLTPAR